MRRPRPAVLALYGIAVAALALLITAGLQDTVLYYRTPTEVNQSTASVGQKMRLGGQVMPGSVRTDARGMEFRLADGHDNLLVIATSAVPDTFREGQGAVVEGVLQPDGTFQADTVAVKHSNEYRPPERSGASG